MIRLLLAAFLAVLPVVSTADPIRIKDLVEFDGVRSNDLVGYGLVVGLNGTGDGLRNAPFTEEMMSNLLERLGVNVTGEDFRPVEHAEGLLEQAPEIDVRSVAQRARALGGQFGNEPIGQRTDGIVLVVDGGGSVRVALLGDMIAGIAAANGWAGLVVNGCVRDVAVPRQHTAKLQRERRARAAAWRGRSAAGVLR